MPTRWVRCVFVLEQSAIRDGTTEAKGEAEAVRARLAVYLTRFAEDMGSGLLSRYRADWLTRQERGAITSAFSAGRSSAILNRGCG